MNSSSSLTTRLQLLIETANSQKEVARLAGVSDGTLINWLRGHGVRPSKLRQVARNIGVSLAWLRDGVGYQDEQLFAFLIRLRGVPPYAPSGDEPWVEIGRPWPPTCNSTIPNLRLPDGAPARYAAPLSSTELLPERAAS